ncbi:MAG: DNA-binding protein [Mesorhizobium sp.]|nr:MAG: DNA-binding protein [Mesorhizobium sp.]
MPTSTHPESGLMTSGCLPVTCARCYRTLISKRTNRQFGRHTDTVWTIEMSRALLSPEDAARELCISEKQLRALTCAGKIRYVNIGLGEKRETRRYDPADLEEFRENRKCLSSSAPANRNTRMTSIIDASDFQARLDARRNARLKKSSNPKRIG